MPGVGAGGGSIASWLCDRVGLTGHVVAVDLETHFLEALDYPNLDIHRLDVAASMVGFLATTGVDLSYGRRLYNDFLTLGLADVDAAGHVYIMRGAHPSSVLPRYTFERIRAQMVALGDVTDADIDEAQADLNDPEAAMMSHVMMAAWGRRPA